MSLSFSLILDILVAVLLVVTIGYAVALNRRLSLLRKDKDELEALTVKFAEATAKADASIHNLKGSTEKVTKELERGLEKAEALRDDLSFLIDRGGSIADRLENGVRGREAIVADRPSSLPQRVSRRSGPLRLEKSKNRRNRLNGSSTPRKKGLTPARKRSRSC